MHDNGNVGNSDQVILSSTRLYEFCDSKQRGDWLDILIALIEYLRSGTSRVGPLNNSVVKNMLHKDSSGPDEDRNLSQVDANNDGLRSSKGVGQLEGLWLLVKFW